MCLSLSCCSILLLCLILKTTLWLTPHLCLNPATLFLSTSYNFLALLFPSSLSSIFPPQGYPLLLSWPPAAHCEVGSRLLSWALTALLSLALMQVDLTSLLMIIPCLLTAIFDPLHLIFPFPPFHLYSAGNIVIPPSSTKSLSHSSFRK